MGLRDVDFDTQYESRDDRNLVKEFYVPALENSVKYDRIAGYFDSAALAVAAQGVDKLVENDGEMRLIVGTELDIVDREVLEQESIDIDEESLHDILKETFTDPETDVEEKRLSILAWLLDNDKLEIRVGIPKSKGWAIFHSKFGIFTDEDENQVSFEGSINETRSAWIYNYERFKVHRSWVEGQEEYVEADLRTFNELWKDEHPYVDVYDLPEAIEKDLVEWKAPDRETIIEISRELPGRTELETGRERDVLNVLKYAGTTLGGTHIAEEASTVTPWPHQRVVANTSMNTYPTGFLLCDEVGLGKTIETGLTISRLVHTEEVRSCLILPPASLTVQWQEELWEKFNLNTYRYTRNPRNEYKMMDVLGNEHDIPTRNKIEQDLDNDRLDEAWLDSPVWRFVHSKQNEDQPAIVIASWHLARLSQNYDIFAPRNGETRTYEEVPASCRGRNIDQREGVWDLTIVDEAHNARRRSFAKEYPDDSPNNLLRFLRILRDHTQCYHLLTATPMQIHPVELYDLLSLVGLPGEWDDSRSFLDFYRVRHALQEVLVNIDHEGDDEDYIGQSTIEGEVQSTLPTDSDNISEKIYRRIASSLDLGDEAQARKLVLDACSLVREYDRVYGSLSEELLGRITRSRQDKSTLRQLLRHEDNYPGFADKKRRSKNLDNLNLNSWNIIADALSESTPVESLVHRNTRETLREYQELGLLDETVPNREPENIEIDLGDAEEVYEHIDDYVKKFYNKSLDTKDGRSNAIGFVMTTYRQRLTSSVYAISRSLERRLENLRNTRNELEKKGEIGSDETEQASLEVEAEDSIGATDEEEIEVLGKSVDEFTDFDLLIDEIEELESFIDSLKHVTYDPKLEQLRTDINGINEKGRDRVVVFTQYTDTMDVIRDNLVQVHGESVGCYSGNGGEIYDSESGKWREVGKERVKRSFSTDHEPIEILVCTDSASEGLNLQECGVLINYDLPWNPMRVEQRIGRIDRIGQQYDDVWILNYSYTDTVETEIYDRLGERINLFEDVVGTMQPILSGVEKQIKEATLDQTDTGGGVEDSLRNIDEEIEADRGAAYEGVQSNLESVVSEARMSAWDGNQHPDIGEAGDVTVEYPYSPPIQQEWLEEFFINTDVLADSDIELESINKTESDDIVDEDWVNNIYILMGGFDIPEQTQEGTVAYNIASDADTYAITFSPECSDEYPSLHLFSYGNPLFEKVIDRFTDSNEKGDSLEFSSLGLAGKSTNMPWVICGWGEDGNIVELEEDFEFKVKEKPLYEGLVEWRDNFVENRSSLTD